MRIAKAVIGSHFGDEGKGRTVDYLASLNRDPPCLRSAAWSRLPGAMRAASSHSETAS